MSQPLQVEECRGGWEDRVADRGDSGRLGPKCLALEREVLMTRAVQELKERIAPVLREHGVRRAAIFGSTARGEDRPGSDLDLLVDFEEGRSLLDLVELRLVLEDLLGRGADVITYASLHPRLRERVLEEQVEIL